MFGVLFADHLFVDDGRGAVVEFDEPNLENKGAQSHGQQHAAADFDVCIGLVASRGIYAELYAKDCEIQPAVLLQSGDFENR